MPGLLNPSAWWRTQSVTTRARWLYAHRRDGCRVTWARFEWWKLQDREKSLIECALWREANGG